MCLFLVARNLEYTGRERRSLLLFTPPPAPYHLSTREILYDNGIYGPPDSSAALLFRDKLTVTVILSLFHSLSCVPD